MREREGELCGRKTDTSKRSCVLPREVNIHDSRLSPEVFVQAARREVFYSSNPLKLALPDWP